MEVVDIKDSAFLVATYQSMIKRFCVLRLLDAKEKVYSLAVKRLNQQDPTQIVVEQSLITDGFQLYTPDHAREAFLELCRLCTYQK